MTVNLRHKRCGEGLEKERHHVQHARKVGTNATAECEESGEEGTGGEEQCDQGKGEHEPRQIEVLASTGKMLASGMLLKRWTIP